MTWTIVVVEVEVEVEVEVIDMASKILFSGSEENHRIGEQWQ